MNHSALIFFSTAISLVFGFTYPGSMSDTAAGQNGVKTDTLNLDAYKGKILVLNFWASWSKASRAENKNIARIYQVYRLNPNVVFASVSLDTEEATWKQAIVEDELGFKDHFCDFRKYDSPMALKLGVTTLPKCFIFDRVGNQVMNAANSHQAEQMLADMLKK